MATREEVMQAIRNADKAGDSASVRKLGAYLQTMDAPAETVAQAPAPDEKRYGLDVPMADRMANAKRELAGLGQQVIDAPAGLIRGAGSIGATLLAPRDALESLIARKMGAPELQIPDRREAMTGALAGMGADPNSLAFGAGKLGAEVAGTLGVGGGIANAAGRVLPAAAAPG